MKEKKGMESCRGPPSYCNSCSKVWNRGSSKNWVMVMSSPSQSFFNVMTDKSRRLGLIRLYTVEGVTPERWRKEHAQKVNIACSLA